MAECRNHWCKNIATHGAHCIFHAPAEAKSAADFARMLSGLVSSWYDESGSLIVDDYDFKDFIFVGDIHAEALTLERYGKEKQPQFSKNAYFGDSHFHGEVSFWGARFEKEVYFGSTTFHEKARFDHAQFSQLALFRNAHFHDEASFAVAKFGGVAEFDGTQFDGEASLNSAEFHDECHFESKEFGKLVDFSYAKFMGGVVFNRYGFGSTAMFREVCSKGAVLFNRCRVGGELEWRWVEPEQNIDEKGNPAARGLLTFATVDLEGGGLLDLRKNPLSDDCRIRLENCEMSKVLLEGTDCTRITFRDVRWPEADDRLFGFIRVKRCVVGDELRARAGGAQSTHTEINIVLPEPIQPANPIIFDSPPDLPWRLVEITYQQLARRFRQDFNHPLANEFDRGVFEVRRRHHEEHMGWWPWDKLRHRSQYLWLSAYKYLSHYSGNLILPFLWLTVIWITFASLYGALDPFHNWFRFWLLPRGWSIDYSHVWAMLALSLRSILTLSTTGTVDRIPLGEGHHTLQAIERAISVIVITLFIFSIRRRFKH